MSKSISKDQLVKKEYDEGYANGYRDKTSVTRRFGLGFDSILEEALGEAYDEGYAHGISDREVSEGIDNITYSIPKYFPWELPKIDYRQGDNHV